MASDPVPTHSLLTHHHILLIENNAADVGILREQIIAAIGPQISIAHTPSLDDALETLNDQQFDAILLNLNADGAESVKRLLDHTNAPIIGLANRANDSLCLQVLGVGAEDYLVKPILHCDTLRHSIHCAIARNTWKNELYNLSFIDDLTGLYNRRGFMTLGEQQLNIAHRTRCGVNLAFADLDALKSINDNFGHSEGDRALQNIATILKNTFQRGSDLIARIGGDEFAVLWIADASFSIDTVRARLKTALDSFIASENLPYSLLLSVGLCQYHPDFSNPLTEMLSEGDQRMYEEKRRSKPHVA
jgi:two-component system, cell cycle response regulator